jgi:hypothetical protein
VYLDTCSYYILNCRQIFFSEAERQHLKQFLLDIMGVIGGDRGIHPKMAGVLKPIFTQIGQVGQDIGKHKRRRTSQRTWKDSNSNTMYLD